MEQDYTPGPDARRVGIAELERRLGLSRTTIARKRKVGLFPEGHFVGERRKWWLHEIERWEAAQASRPAEARRGAANLETREVKP